MRASPASNKYLLCLYREYVHTTHDCQKLEQELERLMEIHPQLWAQLTAPLSHQSYIPQWYSTGPSRSHPSRSDPKPSTFWTEQEAPPDKDNVLIQGVTNIISEGAIDDDSNQVWKRHSRTQCLAVKVPKEKYSPVLGFGSEDLRGVVTPHNDTLVIRAIVTNYEQLVYLLMLAILLMFFPSQLQSRWD